MGDMWNMLFQARLVMLAAHESVVLEQIDICAREHRKFEHLIT